MKKVSLLVLLVFSFIATFSQTYPVTQILGSPQTLVLSKGGLKADSSLIIPSFSDTFAANRSGYINKYPGSLIRVQSNMFIRNATATQWLQFTSSAPSVDTTSLSNRLNGKIDSIRLSGDSVYALRKTIVGGISSTTTTFQYKNPYVKITDTSSMLVPYLRKADTSAMLSKYLRRSDTTAMLSPYVRKVTSISTTAPLTGGGNLSANRTISIPQATSSVNGYLSSTDFTYFNAKVDPSLSISTTLPLQGGGNFFTNRIFSIRKANTNDSGYLSATDYNRFSNKVDTIYRTIGKDSIQFKINGTYFAIKDSSGGSGTVTRAVDTIYRTPGKDSIIFTINGTRRAIKDSAGISGVTGVTASFPMSSIGYPVPNISIPQSSTLQSGYLSVGDWNTFNNKVSSVSATGLLTSSGGTTPDISSSVNSGKLVGRGTASSGEMQEITVGSGLSMTGTTLFLTGGGAGSQNLQQVLNTGDTLSSTFHFSTNNGDPKVNLDGTRLSAPRTYEFPDSSGILALKEDLLTKHYQIDLSASNDTMTNYGVYEIKIATDSAVPYYITFPDANSLIGQRITLVNADISGYNNNALIDTSVVTPKYQGTYKTIWQIPYGMSYEFLSINGYWMSTNPLPVNTQRLEIVDGTADPVTIPFGGIYKTYMTGDYKHYEINFPDPKKNNGERITLINTDTLLSLSIIGTWIPISKNNYGGKIVMVAPQSTYEFVSIDSQWVCVNTSTHPTFFNIDLTINPYDFYEIPSCGVYLFTNSDNSYGALLPANAEWFDGKQIILINKDATYNLILTNAVAPDGTGITDLGTGRSITFTSIGGKWIATASY